MPVINEVKRCSTLDHEAHQAHEGSKVLEEGHKAEEMRD